MSETEATEVEAAEDAVEAEDVDKGMGYGPKMKRGGKKVPAMMMEEGDEEEAPMKKRRYAKADDAIDLPTEVYEYIEALEAANAEMSDELEKMADEFAQEEEDIMKSADPAVVAIVKAAEERAAAAEAIAKAERDFRLEREFVAKAAELPHVAADTDSFGAILKTVAESVDEEVFKALMDVLTTANASIESGELFAELGKSSSFDNDGPMSEINKVAAKLVDADPSLTPEQAVAKAVATDPTLYNAYLRGN